MDIAVTGASGFIGMELLTVLNKKEDVSVIALTRDASSFEDSERCVWRSTDYSAGSLKQALDGAVVQIGGFLVADFLKTLLDALEGERDLLVVGFGKFRLFAARREGENGREGHNCRKQKEQDLFHNRTSNQRATAGASARFPRGSANTDPLLSYYIGRKKSIIV